MPIPSRWSPPGPRTWPRDGAVAALRLLAGRHDELAAHRVQTVTRLHRLLLELVPGGAPVFLSALPANALPATASVALIHLRRGDVPLGSGCSYYGDPTGLLLVGAVATDPSGAGTFVLSIPNDPSLAGGQLFAQHFVIDAGGAFLAQLALSEGLKVVLAPN